MTVRSLLSEVRHRLASSGIRPRASLGQNFLIDANLLSYVERQADLGALDVVLEVGAGTGCLTQLLCKTGARVVAVEVCSELANIVTDDLGHHDNLVLLRADALAGKHQVNPILLEALAAADAPDSAPAVKVIANLPYSIATPFIIALLLSEVEIERMVVMVQKEAAERLVASPGTREYGVPGVIASLVSKIEVLRWVPPEVFWPRPKVESAILSLRPAPARERLERCPESFSQMVRSLFSARRKTLRRALRLLGLDALRARDVTESLAFDSALRVDAVSPAEFALLHGELHRRGA